jgi:aminoglycoside phosphotransferase family enzyme
MTIDLETKLAFLRSQGTLDHVVQCIETHMAWVFLTEDRAWKLKKPVRMPYLDHTTIEQRHHSCVEELRLGRRLAPNVYLDVVPLVVAPGGLAIGGDGEIVDWLVVMRRLPAARMLPRMLAAGTATPADADALAAVLVVFYRDAPRARWTGADYRARLRSTMVAQAVELVSRGAARARVDAILAVQLAAIEREASSLDQRIAEGRVVDAHGDLRPEHVCLGSPPAAPVVIDPLEFNDELRMLDSASELAFFALECERLRAAWFSNRLLVRYLERAGDRVPPGVFALYHNQHALTRALIALRHLDDATPAEQPRWRATADQYLVGLVRGVPARVAR